MGGLGNGLKALTVWSLDNWFSNIESFEPYGLFAYIPAAGLPGWDCGVAPGIHRFGQGASEHK